MAELIALLGEKVVKGKDELVDVKSFAGEGKVVGIYFSAHWCPPCRAFTPQLADWYKKVKAGPNGNNFDMVFVSSDRDEQSMMDYFESMPWHAVPYDDRKRKADLSKKFKVTGIPTLVFVNGENGRAITCEGRSVVMEDPEGNNFPWTPKPFSEIIQGNFVNKDGEETKWEDLSGKVVGLYFSAHWCGPCRVFTPELVKTYNKLKEDGKNFEIIFCSSDRDEDSMKEYLGEMPWLALPFGDSRKTTLSRLFDVSGIPTLVILDENGKVITTAGRAAVSADPDGAEFPWHPKPLNELMGATASGINEVASVILFTDGEEESMKKAKETLQPVAEKYVKKCKDKEEDPELIFFYAGEDEDDLSKSLRSFASLESRNPLLVIVDIPNQEKFVSEETDPDEQKVQEFIDDYLEGKLTGKPLKD